MRLDPAPLRRFFSALMAVIFGWFVVVMPARAVTIPMTLVGGVYTYAPKVGALVRTGQIIAGVGGAVGAVAMNPLVGLAVTVATVCLEATGSIICMRSSNAPRETINPPATTPTLTGFRGAYLPQVCMDDVKKCAQLSCKNMRPDLSLTATFPVQYTPGQQFWFSCAGYMDSSIYPVVSCPSGYTLSGSTCNLTDPTKVMRDSDGVAVLNSTSTGWVPDPQDPDNATLTTPSNPIVQTGPNELGQPAQTTITSTPDGGMKVENWAQTFNTTTNNNQVTYNSVTINSNGVVTNNNTATYSGTLSQAVNGSAPLSNSLNLPTDYNREATQAKIYDELKGGTLTAPTATDVWDPAKSKKLDDDLKGQFDAIPNAYQQDKNNWFSWVWTPPVGVCSPFTGEVSHIPVSWDFCPTINNIRDTIGWLFALFGAWDVYNVMFRRPD